jgi:cation-transporting ATPase 13A1
MLVVFEATVVKSRMRNTDEMRSMSNPASRCTVLRHGKWTALSSEALLPGDLLSISRAPPVHGEPVTTLLPADVLLLHGTAVVNESALTVCRAGAPTRDEQTPG